MRILIAGATGAIGRLSIRRLQANQHEVFALTRSPDSAPALREIGAEAVIADALDATAVKAAVGRIRPDAVINELTSLPRHYTPAEMKAAAERDRKVRVEGNINLLAALRDAGVRRYLLQSSGFWYAPGPGLADEFVPFISRASPGVEAGAGTYRELEARASAMPGIEFVALRYGFFYGPGGYSPGHTHPKSAFIYATVLEGAIRSQVNDGPVTTYKAGQCFSELPGDRHVISANASNTKSAKLLAVFVVDTNETELTIPFGH